jgi:hypothetical protein
MATLYIVAIAQKEKRKRLPKTFFNPDLEKESVQATRPWKG